MRRSRLELVLVSFLALSLAGLLVFRPTPRDAGGSGSLFGAIPQPCTVAIDDAASARVPRSDDVERVARAVERLRGLRFDETPEPIYLAPGPFRDRVLDGITYPADEAEIDGRTLAALGAVPEGFDVREEVAELAGEQVVGFYDTETKDLVVSADGTEDGLDAIELLTLVHELEHALADQALGLPDLDPPDADAGAAAHALVEGDATLLTEVYAAQALTAEDQLGLLFGAPFGLGGVPHHLGRSLSFPYVEGSAFVCALYRDGGWEAVDAAYADPPTTTAQVLFPERYLEREGARDPRDTDGPGDRWDDAGSEPLGAADLLFLFEAPGGRPALALDRVRQRVAAWGGGQLRVWTDDDATAVAMLLVERPGGVSLCRSMAAWYRAAFEGDRERPGQEDGEELSAAGGRQSASVRCEGREVRVGIAPDLETARVIAR